MLGEGALDGKDDGSELDVETVGSETDGDELNLWLTSWLE